MHHTTLSSLRLSRAEVIMIHGDGTLILGAPRLRALPAPLEMTHVIVELPSAAAAIIYTRRPDRIISSTYMYMYTYART